MKIACLVSKSSVAWLTVALLGTACSKKEAPPAVTSDTQAASSAGVAPKVTPPQSASAGETVPVAVSEPAPAEEVAAEAGALGCAEAGWERIEVKALQDGGLSVPADGAQLPQFTFDDCEGTTNCTRLALSEGFELLAVGQNGNSVRLAVSESCGDDEIVWLADGAGKVISAFRGHDIDIQTAVTGGDRLLLSGIARHRTPNSPEGFVASDYLFSARSGAPKKVEAVRNKQTAKPIAASSQLVVVEIAGALCTTAFWKLGVEQCDFAGPPSAEWAAFGAHLLFAKDGAGKTYGAKEGERDLLPALDWIITDGVNVAWSASGALTMTQPKYDLSALAADPAPGVPGPKPLAIGCQRLLSQVGDEYHLRNVKLGTEFVFATERLPADSGKPAALGCDKLYTTNGYTLGFGLIGKPVPLEPSQPADPAKPADTAAPTAPGATGEPTAPAAPGKPAASAQPSE